MAAIILVATEHVDCPVNAESRVAIALLLHGRDLRELCGVLEVGNVGLA